MKINTKIYLILAAFLLVFTACEPIVEEHELTNTTAVEAINLSATNTTPGGNQIKLELKTPGISGYFDYITGKSLTDSETIVFPVTGTFDFTYKGTLGSELFEKKVPVTITTLDHPVQPEWSALLGSNPVAGKTWVFDGAPGEGKLWWFMSANDNPSGAMGPWWNAGDCCPPSDFSGKMKFDLNGSLNFYHYETPTATPTKGRFDLNIPNKTLTIFNSKMLGNEAGSDDNSFTIISLSEDKMVLYVPKSIKDRKNITGWTFVFKPE